MRITALLLTSLLIAACSNVQPVTEVEEDEGPVSILTGKTGGLKWSDISNTFDNKSTGMPVNAVLWRASLEIVSLIPIADVDTFGGTIVSDWYSLPGKPNERIKVTVFVIGRELRSDAIRITVHVQTRNSADGEWSSSVRDDDFGNRLEDLVLNRAREIRAGSITEVSE
ncbi:MAG: DUF3576 domain-containing protein [Pseudomonadota bacterium]|nr:DUF3576 domain-containing protein [Pseudomonadota bacterium]